MIRKPLALRIYDAANLQRWNDKICPVELRELDKQAHKMVIAYVIARFEQQGGSTVSWLGTDLVRVRILGQRRSDLVTALPRGLCYPFLQDSELQIATPPPPTDRVAPAGYLHRSSR